MNNSSNWEKFKQYNYSNADLGFALDYSRVSFEADFFDAHKDLIRKSLIELSALEAGDLVNFTEKRMVGHYWLRSAELAPENLQAVINETKSNIQEFSKKILAGDIKSLSEKSFKNLLLIGIGGSALGPQLIYSALSEGKGLKTYFFDNTDPDGFIRTIRSIDSLAETLVLVISKSGSTPETLNGQTFAWNYFKDQGLEPSKNFVAVTGDNSVLYNQAKEHNWLATFPMWDWVGGRTSIWSAVGLLPAALQGIDIEALLAGANSMDKLTRQQNHLENPALIIALLWGKLTNWKGEKVMVVLPYKDRLSLFGAYLQQLIMESLGKKFDKNGKVVNQGISVFGNKGSTDQHSYIQQLREGVANFFALFVRVLKDTDYSIKPELLKTNSSESFADYLDSFLLGTREALTEEGRASITITLDRINAKTLGALLALFERAVTFYASMVDINAYDQPGVEAGKKSASEILKLKKSLAMQELDSSQNLYILAEKLASNYNSNPQIVYDLLLALSKDN